MRTDPAGKYRLDGQCAIVTGGAAGIGFSVVSLLFAAGANVVAVDRDADALAQAIARIASDKGRVIAYRADVSDEGGAQTIVDTALAEFGRIDVLVNNAGIYPPSPRLPDMNLETAERVFSVNLFGAMRLAGAAAAAMPAGGRIINMSSIESLRPSSPSNSYYGTSKGAMNAFTRAAALDLAPRGIRVNAVLPGIIATEGTSAIPDPHLAALASRAPSGRIGKPHDIAEAVLFLASGASDYVNGHCLVVDGGLSAVG
ncbi:SDR family NAD(P)-dependent oxidoreductase [Novosphingobium malaysiense]|uniref:Short-chain dehydrogenase n=1 Tax=Novosphingobium malaysiense TaxID=1348853 RepID=A0A0B1ZLX5_9SPHN|nr:glucose 1-dehydrogenase [Novosphingobium malaysiense]KHK90178.1 hypothetical protein LK12_16040 [Novosphingobium malaysiense]